MSKESGRSLVVGDGVWVEGKFQAVGTAVAKTGEWLSESQEWLGGRFDRESKSETGEIGPP